MQESQAELLGGPSCELGEGPVWHAAGRGGEGELAWVDIPGQAIHRATLRADATLGGVRVTDVGGDLGASYPSSPAAGCWPARRVSRTSPTTTRSPHLPNRRPDRVAPTG